MPSRSCGVCNLLTWGVEPGLPIYLLNGLSVLEVVTEVVLEVSGCERLELEVL